MFKWLLKADKGADLLSRWFLVYSVMTGVYTWLATHVRLFAHFNWAELVFIGIGCSLITALVVATTLAMIRYFRPSPNMGLPVLDHKEGSSHQTRIGALEKRCAAVEEKNKVIIQDYQTVLGKIAQIEENLTEHKKSVSDITAAQEQVCRKRIEAVTSNLAMVQRDCASLAETVKKNNEHIRQSLHAVSVREQMKEFEGRIERLASELYQRFAGGEHYTSAEWDEWVNTHRNWERTLNTWIDLSRWYAKDVQKNILTIDDREYDAPWTVRDEQFPNADAVWRFKRHRIIQSHWENVRDQVERGVERVAFSGQTEQEQHGGKYHQ